MDYREYLQIRIYRITDPLIHLMARLKITPNALTFFGFLLNLGAAVLFCFAGFAEKASAITLVGTGGCLVIAAGLFDMFDGRLARTHGMQSAFGALFDSTMDRYSEIVTLAGIFIFLFYQGYPAGGVLTIAALAGSLMVSYVRARAEGLGIECKNGIMQRPERVVITATGCILCWIFKSAATFDPVLILVWSMAAIAIFANLTAFARIRHCRNAFK